MPSEDGALVKSVEFTYKMLIHLDFQGQQAFGSKQPFEIKHMALVFLYLPFFPSSPLSSTPFPFNMHTYKGLRIYI